MIIAFNKLNVFYFVVFMKPTQVC